MHKRNRLRASADYQRVRREGSSVRHRLLVLAYLPNHLGHSRFGFAISRRIGSSVKRNRLRRQMREIVRLRLKEGLVAAGWDIVLIARRPIEDASYAHMDRAIDLVLRRAGLASETL